MPETRGDQRRRQQYIDSPPPPAMSPSRATISVSEPFRDQSAPRTIRRSEAFRKCIENVRECMGETIPFNSRLTIAPTPMATGGYGQETAFTFNPQQRNKSGFTVAALTRAAHEVKDRIWTTDEGAKTNQEVATEPTESVEQRAQEDDFTITTNQKGINDPSALFQQSDSDTGVGFTARTVGENQERTLGDDINEELYKKRVRETIAPHRKARRVICRNGS